MDALNIAREYDTVQYIVIKIGEEQYGIDISYIDNIVNMQSITRVPHVQPYFAGVINIRGEVVPVMSSRLKMDLEAEIKKNVEKRNARLRRAGIDPEKLNQRASMSTKSISVKASVDTNSSKATLNGKPVDSTEYYNKNASKPGSLAAKANMVKQYNERNNK